MPGAGEQEKKDLLQITMSLKQLCQTVRNGQQLTFWIFDGDEVTGYLAGLDGETCFVLEPYGAGRSDFRRKIIRFIGNPVFEIHPENTYDGEPAHDEMEEIIRSFRAWVMRKVFSYGRPKSDERVA